MEKKRINRKELHPVKGKVFPYEFFTRLLSWLHKVALCKYAEVTTVIKVLRKIRTVYDTRGKSECIVYCKSLRRSYVNYLFDDHITPKGSNHFLPKILKPFGHVDIQDKNYPLIRLILSVLYISRFIRLEPKASHQSIEDGPRFHEDPSDLKDDMSRFLKDLGVNRHQQGKIPKALRFKEFHMTSKSGPNGHALWTSYRDLDEVPKSLRDSIRVVAGDKLPDLMSRLELLYRAIPSFFDSYASRKGVSEIRRLAVIADKEGKSREVAILDYWSQSALKPLHSYIFKMLDTINQDCTHNQIKHIHSIRTNDCSRFHSVDLTTATDRFPIVLERLMLSVWFGEEFAENWQNIMVGYPFDYKGRYIRYGTGNPMGAYSSWAIFSLCHHFFIWKACRNARKNWKRCPYMLLGDDIVIADDTVAEEYKKLLVLWDVPFSPDKSHVSKLGFEFAKQLVLDERNISPFPLAALFERRNSPIESVGIILQELTNKDWLPAKKLVWSHFVDYFMIVQGWNRPRIRQFLPKLKLVISLLRHLQSNEDLGIPLREYVASTTKEKVSWVPMTARLYAQFIAGNSVTNLFEAAVKRITDKTNKLPLGELATEMVMAITSTRDGGVDCFDLIESVPFLQIYGRAEEKYLQLIKPNIGSRLIRDGTEMRAALGKVDIPLSDTDFFVRRRDILVIQALRAAKEMIALIDSHRKSVRNYYRNPIGVARPL